MLAAVVRVLGLDAKGFWEDEAATVFLLREDLGGMLADIDGERAPPLYYLLAWFWTHLFGYGEVGLRSLSVLIGTTTIPVAYLAARELVSRRAGIVVAALVAVNPLLVWYAQEGRTYALLVLLSGLALFFFARALRDKRPRWLALWALSSALAISAHYFAAFLFITEAVWLLVSAGRQRPVAIASSFPAAVGLAFVPLAVSQSDNVTDDWIGDISLAQRVAEFPGFFMVGFEVPYPIVIGLAAIAAALVVAAVALLLSSGAPTERRGALIAGAVGLGGLILPLAMVAAGLDFFIYKNLLATVLPFAIVVGAGFAAPGVGRVGVGLAACLIALSLAIVVGVSGEPKYQRETWREAAEALGTSEGARAIVATPGEAGERPLNLYMPEARPIGDGTALVSEIDILALPRRDLGEIENPEVPSTEEARLPPPTGFALVESRRTGDFLLLRHRAPSPTQVSVAQLAAQSADREAEALVLLQPAPQ